MVSSAEVGDSGKRYEEEKEHKDKHDEELLNRSTKLSSLQQLSR